MIQIIDRRKQLARDQILAEHLADVRYVCPDALRLSPALYVGANPRSKNYWLKELIDNKVAIDVVETLPEYCEWLRKQTWINHVFKYSLLDLSDIGIEKFHEAVIWREGPQYLSPDRLALGIQICERLARRYVVLATPWAVPQKDGLYQGVKNLHPIKAYAYLTPEHFDALGYDVIVRLVDEDQIRAFMFIWKEIK
jgi:hypothetical protein